MAATINPGRLIDTDILVDAARGVPQLELCSKNVRHFGMIPGLKIMRPY